MSVNYREPQWLLPNEKNLQYPAAGATQGSGLTEDRHSLYSMDFDGTDYISTSDIRLGNTYSISLWFNADSFPSTNPVLISQYTSGLAGRFFLGVRDDGGGRKITAFSAAHNYGSTVISTSTWYNVVLVNNNNTVTLYLNGAVDGNFTFSSAPPDTNILIGSLDTTPSNTWDGEIDEVAIFSRALSSDEVTTLYNSGSPSNPMLLSGKPEAYYPLGEQARKPGTAEWRFPNEVLQSQAVDFTTADYVSIPHISVSSAFSVSAWVNTTDASTYGNIFSSDEAPTGGTSRNWQVIRWNTKARFILRDSGGSAIADINGGTINDGTWHHILATWDGTTGTNKVQLYVDGTSVAQGTASSTALANSSIPMVMGGSSATWDFIGKISNVAIWNSDQSTNKDNIYNYGAPQTSYTVTPTAWYKLDKTSEYAGLNPNWNNALSFDGAIGGALINVGNDSSLNITDSLSVSAWFKTLNNSDTIMIATKDNGSTSRAWQLYMHSTGVIRFGVNGVTGLAISSGTYDDGEWHHVLAVYEPSNYIKLYIDSIQDGQSTVGIPASIDSLPSQDVVIGGYSVYDGVGGRRWDGELSNIAIYNQTISGEDIKYLYNGGTPQTNLSFEPLSWWKLDNLTTGIQDSGSASNNGTNNGATEVTDSVAVDQWNFDNAAQSQTPNWSSALDFSGSNQWIDCGVDSSIDTGDLSVAFWFNKDSSASGYQYVFNSGSGSAKAGFVFAFSGTNIYVGRKTLTHTAGFTTYTNIGISADKWHHIAFTYNDTSNNFIAYLDGQSVHTSTGASATNAASSEIIFGRISNVASSYYKGKISNAAIFNTELNAAAISTLYNNGQPETAISSSPVSWYKLDNTTTGIQDSGSASNNGTNNGATEIQTNVWTPRLNAESSTLPSSALTSSDLQFNSAYSSFSLDFDGTDYVDCTDNDMFSFGDSASDSPFSISAWVNFEDVSSSVGIISKYGNSSSTREWLFYIAAQNFRFLLQDGSYNNYATATSTTISTDQWYHVVATYNGVGGANANQGMNIYVNGQLQTLSYAGSSSYVAMHNTSQPVEIARYGGSAYTSGNIDEVCVFNKVLNQAEITSIYNNGYPKDITALAPISWWRLGEDAYYDGTDFTIPNKISGAPNGTSNGMPATALVADAPGSYAAGLGSSLALDDRVGDAALSTANSLSFNMTPVNRVSYPAGYVPTQADNVYSMAFDGVDDRIWVNSQNDIDLGTTCTISFWMKGATSYNGFIFGQSGTNLGIVWATTTAFYFYVDGSFAPNFTNVPPLLTANNWHHVAITRDGTSVSVYVNGSFVETQTGSPFTASTKINQIGARGSTSSINMPWEGELDEVAFWNTVLSARQIKQDIYNGTTSGKTADLNNISNLTAPVAWYRMGD